MANLQIISIVYDPDNTQTSRSVMVGYIRNHILTRSRDLPTLAALAGISWQLMLENVLQFLAGQLKFVTQLK